LRWRCGMALSKPNGFPGKRKSLDRGGKALSCEGEWGGSSIFVFVEEEVILSGIIRPDILDAFIELTFVLHFLKVLNHFQRSAGADGVIDQFVPGGRPGGFFEVVGKFKCPIHGTKMFN